eukprot:EG_transcript_10306
MAAPSEPTLQLLPTPIVLPLNLRGHVKYIAGLDKESGLVYSIGIRFVLPTAGAQHLLDRLRAQRYREHKRPVVGTLCPSLATGAPCPEGVACAKIHAEPEGYQLRRLRERAPRTSTEGPGPDGAPPATPSAPPPASALPPLGPGRPTPPSPPSPPPRSPVPPPTPRLGLLPSSRRRLPLDGWDHEAPEWDDISEESASDGSAEPSTPLRSPRRDSGPPAVYGALVGARLVATGALRLPFLPALPQHLFVPVRLELLRQGHTGHNPYAWNTFWTAVA